MGRKTVEQRPENVSYRDREEEAEPGPDRRRPETGPREVPPHRGVPGANRPVDRHVAGAARRVVRHSTEEAGKGKQKAGHPVLQVFRRQQTSVMPLVILDQYKVKALLIKAI